MNRRLDDRLVPQVQAVEHPDRQVQWPRGQARLVQSVELEHPAHWATLGAAA
jgi:hypothetical protein